MVEGGFSRIPVYEGGAGQHDRRRLHQGRPAPAEKRQPVVLRKILQPVHFVPETKKVGDAAQGAAEAAHAHGAWSWTSTARSPAWSRWRTCSRRSSARSRTSTTGRSGPWSACATARWWWTGRAGRGRAARGVRHPHPGVRGVRDRGRLHAGLAGLGARAAARWSALGDYRLTVVDVERNRISKVKIERMPAAVKRPPRTILRA